MPAPAAAPAPASLPSDGDCGHFTSVCARSRCAQQPHPHPRRRAGPRCPRCDLGGNHAAAAVQLCYFWAAALAQPLSQARRRCRPHVRARRARVHVVVVSICPAAAAAAAASPPRHRPSPVVPVAFALVHLSSSPGQSQPRCAALLRRRSLARSRAASIGGISTSSICYWLFGRDADEARQTSVARRQ